MSAFENQPSYFRADSVPPGVAVEASGHRGVLRRVDAPFGQWDDLVESVLSHEEAAVGLTTAAIFHGLSRATGADHTLLVPRARRYGKARVGIRLVGNDLPDAAFQEVEMSGVHVRISTPAATVVHMLTKSPIATRRALVDEEEALDALYGYLNFSSNPRAALLEAARLLGAPPTVIACIKGALGATNPN